MRRVEYKESSIVSRASRVVYSKLTESIIASSEFNEYLSIATKREERLEKCKY